MPLQKSSLVEGCVHGLAAPTIMVEPAPKKRKSTITTLVLDIDDTLYDVGTGFTAHRNGESCYAFMVAKLGFPSNAEAALVRDKYFAAYHSTVKGLTVAEKEGALPKGAHFEADMLADWWTEHLDFEKFLTPNPRLIESLRRCPLKLVAFTNAPRRYGIKVVEALGLREFFPDERFYAVEDVMPTCKPEPQAFANVLERVGSTPEASIMVEDSMKNIRAAKKIGMGTILVSGLGHNKAASEATKPGDAPVAGDPAVDASVADVSELEAKLPELWQEGISWPPVR